MEETMKTKKYLLIVLVFAVFYHIGCSSTKAPAPVPVQYSFAGDEYENGTAAITFIHEKKVGVRLVDNEGITIPTPTAGTYWDSAIIFPAAKALNIRVYVYWKEDQYGERRRGIFKCPPLEANREYKVWFSGNYKKGGSLILTYSNVSSLGSLSRNPQDKVYEQVVPPMPKK
jgi:hypothetical protein